MASEHQKFRDDVKARIIELEDLASKLYYDWTEVRSTINQLQNLAPDLGIAPIDLNTGLTLTDEQCKLICKEIDKKTEEIFKKHGKKS